MKRIKIATQSSCEYSIYCFSDANTAPIHSGWVFSNDSCTVAHNNYHNETDEGTETQEH